MYNQVIEKKVIKIKHVISIKYGMKASSIIKDFKKVSDKALLTNFNEDEQTITFEEEKIL